MANKTMLLLLLLRPCLLLLLFLRLMRPLATLRAYIARDARLRKQQQRTMPQAMHNAKRNNACML
jgi:hypothetical protein